MIDVNNLKVAFGEKIVLDNININIEKGDFVIVTGESGCGKTTLLNCLMLLENYSGGDIIYNGKSYGEMSNREKVKTLKIDFGIVFQDFGLIEDMSVYSNLAFVKKNKSRVMEKLEEFNLDIDLNTKVSVLSGGEKQRLALVRVALKRCKIVFCDEPTGNLDDENTYIVMNYLKKMNESGQTIIMVTHDKRLKKYGNNIIEL